MAPGVPTCKSVDRGVAQPGRAPGSGPGGRRFESSLPDHSLSSTETYSYRERSAFMLSLLRMLCPILYPLVIRRRKEGTTFSLHTAGLVRVGKFTSLMNPSANPRLLEIPLDTDLNLSWTVGCVGDGSEIRIVYRRVGCSKDRVVESVLGFDAEFELRSRA